MTFTIKTAWNKFGQLIQDILGMDREQMEMDYEQYKLKLPAASANDYMWGLFNRMLLESAGDFFKQSLLYHCMAIFMSRYEGRNGHKFKKLSIESSISKVWEKYETSNYEMELVVFPDTDCPHAMSLKGKRFPLGLELANILASDECNQDLCRCVVRGMGKKDENGRLIRKDGIKEGTPKFKRWWEFWR